MGRVGAPEVIIILTISLLTLVPIAVAVWLALIVLGTRAKQTELEARVEALERAQRRP